jgi:hypothetical protein
MMASSGGLSERSISVLKCDMFSGTKSSIEPILFLNENECATYPSGTTLGNSVREGVVEITIKMESKKARMASFIFLFILLDGC